MNSSSSEGGESSSQFFPRVLIVQRSLVYNADQHNLLTRSLFGSWPKDRIAQIYSGAETTGTGSAFCSITFELGTAERRFGSVFFRLKSHTENPAASSTFHTYSGVAVRPSVLLRSRNKLGRLVLDSGIWEIVFGPKLSTRLLEWIDNYKPEIIYCQGYSLAFCWIPMMLQKYLDIPMVFHPADDWPNQLYSQSPMMKRLVLRTTKRLIQQATMRLAFSERMSRSYEVQFGKEFDGVIMHSDSAERFESAAPIRVVDEQHFSIVYTGGLLHGRWQSLAELAQVVDEINGEDNRRITVTAFVSLLPPEASAMLSAYRNLRIMQPPPHEQVPSYLKGADILFIPETFDMAMATDIRYSITTKAHLYMMSRRPILVYGSPESGTVDYAIRENWAYVVPVHSPQALKTALIRLITEPGLAERLVNAAQKTASNNHREDMVRKRFRAVFRQAIRQYPRNHRP